MSSEDQSAVDKPAASRTTATFDAGSGPALTADSIDEFVRWAATVPVGDVEVIRARVGAARGDDAVFDRLIGELWSLPVADIGRHQILLSTLGELGDSRAAPELARFAWHEAIVETPPPETEQGCVFEARPTELLQARATEMLSYLGTDEAIEETLRIAAEHPRAGVRAAAIDAHLYNHNDAPEEAERLRNRVRGEDRALVGVPRFTRTTDRREFERAVLEFYARNPEQRPPAIDFAGPPAPATARPDTEVE